MKPPENLEYPWIGDKPGNLNFHQKEFNCSVTGQTAHSVVEIMSNKNNENNHCRNALNNVIGLTDCNRIK